MKSTVNFFFLQLVFVATTFYGQAQTKNYKFLSKTFDKVILDHIKTNSLGCDVLIYKKGQVIYQKTFGKANLELNVPLKPDMIFQIGSISKQFTAVAILKLVEEGKITLEDDIRKYFPKFPTNNNSITIENLLTHSSGITDDIKEFDENQLLFSKFSQDEMIGFFKDIPLKFEPGTQVSYSSAGFLMLGYIIEKVAGKKYTDYLQETFFNPLQMTNSYFDDERKIITNRAYGYEKNKFNKIINSREDLIGNHPAGGVLTTSSDYLKWHKALFNFKIITKASLEKAISPYQLKNGEVSNFGYGFEIDNAFGIPIIHHGGRTFGFNAHEMYAKNDDVLVIVLNNQSMLDLTDLTTILTHLAIGKNYNYNEVSVSNKILDAYIGKYKWNEVTDQNVSIFRKGKRLMFKDSNNSYDIEMHFTSNNTFFIYKYGFMMNNTFLKDKSGKITGFNVSGNGESFNAKKIE